MGDLDGRRDPEQARGWYTKGLAIAERLVALEPENTQYLEDCLFSCQRLAGLESADTDTALIWWRRWVLFSTRLVDLVPTIENKRALSQGLIQLAIQEQKINPEAALQG